jgi:arylsulfatase A-like enzyme
MDEDELSQSRATVLRNKLSLRYIVRGDICSGNMFQKGIKPFGQRPFPADALKGYARREKKMKKQLIAVSSGLSGFISWAFSANIPAEKPNIVFILADDLGFMDVGVNNSNTFYETPNIDRLAVQGMRFTAGYAACPVCSPTRASILTGKYPPRVGLTRHIGRDLGKSMTRKLLPPPNGDHLDLGETTIAEALRAAGYEIFFAGKWHLGDSAQYSPNMQGFGSDLVKTDKAMAFISRKNLQRVDRANDPKNTDLIVNTAVEFIQGNKDNPFFAFLSFEAVHTPIGARADLIEKYQRKKAGTLQDQWGQERDSKVRLIQNDAVYAAMLEQMDTAVGRLLDTLDRTGLAERTMVILMSDNGGECVAGGAPTANAPLRAGKGWLYEGGIREPWIIRAPGLTKPGSLCDTPVISTDFYPTILDFAGLPLNPAQHMDGMSLVPLLKLQPLERGPLFWHFPHYANQGGFPSGAVRDGDWKLIEWYEDGQLELFNLRADPGEQKNLAAENPVKAKELQARLAAWRTEVKAVMPAPNTNWVESVELAAPKK